MRPRPTPSVLSRLARRRRHRLDGLDLVVGGSRVHVVAFDGRGIDLSPTRCTLVWASFAERYARSPVAGARPLHEWRERLAAEHEWLEGHPATTDTSRVALIRLDEVTRPGRVPREWTLQLADTPDSHRRVAREGWTRRGGHDASTRTLAHVDPFFSASLRVVMTVITADGRTVVARWTPWEGSTIARRRVGVDVLVDHRDVVALTDVDLRLACARGLEDGLGVALPPADLAAAVRFHSLVQVVDDHEWAVLGTIDLRGTRWTAGELGVGGAVVDTSAQQPVVQVPFTAEAVVAQAHRHVEWDACGLVALVLSALADAGDARSEDAVRVARALAALT